MVVLNLFSVCLFAFISSYVQSLASAEDLQLEARMPPCDLIKYHGYPCEITHATTEDGYILDVFRIAHGIQGNASRVNDESQRRVPLLLVPSLMAPVDEYFWNLPSQSPGFLFADNGFDVWAMCVRENQPYVRHKKLSQEDPKFWQFSFDEMGRYDVAAAIDHVLNATGATKLTILGYSQGTLSNFILHSTRPEYSEKVSLFIAYAPIGNITHIGLPLKLILPYVPSLLKLVYPFTLGGYLGSSHGLQELFSAVCSILWSVPCGIGTALTGTFSPEQLNKTRVPVYAGRFLLGTTVQNFLHFYQIYKAKNLVMYDHGKDENRRRYGQVTPPPYPIERIKVPIAMFSSQGDVLADTADVTDLAYRLGTSLVFHRVVPQASFTHQDFVSGNRANDFLHNTAIELAKKYSAYNP
ncbi:lipase member K isoform X1 [Rhipicephalus microplus]|uniref:lipase member K isoform X1 n=1 Tax=Rhipicephalus microplus TaxID=6941 RepID=UPI003F6BB79F